MKRSSRQGWLCGGGCVLAIAFAFSATTASGIEYDLTANSSVSVVGDVGGTAIFANQWTQPTGTGVFDPFLTIERAATGGNPSYYEQGYNTAGHVAMYLDETRPTWNTLLTVGDLARVDRGGILYYCFILDANEPGGNKSLISIDNIRIYTSDTDNTAAVGSNLNNLDSLGSLRWAMNQPTVNPDGSFNDTDWVKLDADQENVGYNSNGGSGMSDMILYVPVTAFGTAQDDDYVWFYNLNGVKYSVDSTQGAQAGYEEWRAVRGVSVPDGGATLALIGIAITGLGLLRRRIG